MKSEAPFMSPGYPSSSLTLMRVGKIGLTLFGVTDYPVYLVDLSPTVLPSLVLALTDTVAL